MPKKCAVVREGAYMRWRALHSQPISARANLGLAGRHHGGCGKSLRRLAWRWCFATPVGHSPDNRGAVGAVGAARDAVEERGGRRSGPATHVPSRPGRKFVRTEAGTSGAAQERGRAVPLRPTCCWAAPCCTHQLVQLALYLATNSADSGTRARAAGAASASMFSCHCSPP